MDWHKVFFEKPIMVVLSRHLSIVDLFKLSMLDKMMYTKWISSACIDAVDMRALVERRFGWKYKQRNPFVWVRKHMKESRLPFTKKPKTFRCTGGCGKANPASRLVSSIFSKHAMCSDCMFPINYHAEILDKFGNRYDRINEAVWRHIRILRAKLRSEYREMSFGKRGIESVLGDEPFEFARIQRQHYSPAQMLRQYYYGNQMIVAITTVMRNVEIDFAEYQLSEEQLDEERKRIKLDCSY